MCFRIFILIPILVQVLAACSDTPSRNIDAEPALGALGGAILGTQNGGLVTRFSTPKPAAAERLLRFFDPISEAYASIAACPAVTDPTSCCTGPGGNCPGTGGNILQVFYNNCQTAGFAQAGLRRSYISYEFSSAADCTYILTNGFNAAGGAAGLKNKSVVRGFGAWNGAVGDEVNIRLALTGQSSYFYSAFPSGWQDSRTGGATITFLSATERQIVISGIHALGVSYTSISPAVATESDLSSLPGPDGSKVLPVWDHTINTVKKGDALFQIGPVLTQAASGAVSFGTQENDTTAPFDGDILVTDTTVAVGATLRVQQNISQSIGIAVVTQPLVYSDPTCCWPSSGEVDVEYDRNLKSPTLAEKIVFTGKACGAITYTSSVLNAVSETLNNCF